MAFGQGLFYLCYFLIRQIIRHLNFREWDKENVELVETKEICSDLGSDDSSLSGMRFRKLDSLMVLMYSEQYKHL